MEEKERYELIGYCSYRDTETGVIGDNFVGVLNEQDKKIKDLKAKLEEKETDIIALDTENYSFKQQIDSLRQQLAESENKVKGFVELFDKKQHENYEQFCEIMQLKQQLAEKEKYIEEQEFAEYKEMFYATQELKEDCELKILELEKQYAKFKQLQNQTAIRELEKVKKFLVEKIEEKQSCFDSGNYNDFADGVKTICELMLISIDNQIKELGGGDV